MSNIDLIRVVDVDYLKDFTMVGRGKEDLKDPDKFIQFGLNHWTLEWYNGIDFAPDFLYRNGQQVAS